MPMFRRFTLALLWTTFALTSSGCGKQEAVQPPKETSGKETVYHCPMHPHIIQENPGSCPICGMSLAPIRKDALQGDTVDPKTDASGSPVIRVAPERARNMALRTEPVEYRQLSRELRLNGKVAVNEDRIFSVTSRVSGYVERLPAVFVGQKIRLGETLIELYSPELLAAQQEYLQGAGNAPAARARLQNLGLPSAFLDRLETTRQVQPLVPLAAPSRGTLIRKQVVKGQAVSPRMELFRIADLSKVWVTARLHQSDLAWVRIGSKASVRLPGLPGKDFEARVIFISPELDASTRTAELRLELGNTPDQAPETCWRFPRMS
jgi:Cu(I)/Ag(I) efflux system membrane fusion protein